MLKRKLELHREADALIVRINELQSELQATQNSDEKKVLIGEINRHQAHFLAIENMSTWPVDLKTRLRFRVNNMLLLFPLVGDIAKRSVEVKYKERPVV